MGGRILSDLPFFEQRAEQTSFSNTEKKVTLLLSTVLFLSEHPPQHTPPSTPTHTHLILMTHPSPPSPPASSAIFGLVSGLQLNI